MSRRSMFSILSAVAVLLCFTVGAIAQTAPAQKKPGMMSRMMAKMKPGAKQGNVIGNKNTKVFHLPGDKGALPAEKNRVYFKTAKEAEAAGYHRAGAGGAKTATTTKKMPARDPKTGKFIKSPGK